MTGFCVVEYCDRLPYAKGYCKRHYTQILRHGHLTSDSDGREVPKCSAPDCEKDQVSKGYCRKHGRQMKTYGELRPDREYMTGKKVCSESDCGLPVRAKGLCAKHYTRKRRSEA
jgi:hypothetical protein